MAVAELICEPDGTGGFVADVNGDPATYFPCLWRWAVERYRVATVLDVGCGCGAAVRAFRALGCRVTGIDGSATAATTWPADVTHHDLRQGPWRGPDVDLVWCCEVVEHIEREYLASLRDTLALGRVVMMTHAFPKQGGYHHKNLQPPGYWIMNLHLRGYRLDAANTMESRRFAWQDNRDCAHNHWLRSGMIFKRHSDGA